MSNLRRRDSFLFPKQIISEQNARNIISHVKEFEFELQHRQPMLNWLQKAKLFLYGEGTTSQSHDSTDYFENQSPGMASSMGLDLGEQGADLTDILEGLSIHTVVSLLPNIAHINRQIRLTTFDLLLDLACIFEISLLRGDSCIYEECFC